MIHFQQFKIVPEKNAVQQQQILRISLYYWKMPRRFNEQSFGIKNWLLCLLIYQFPRMWVIMHVQVIYVGLSLLQQQSYSLTPSWQRNISCSALGSKKEQLNNMTFNTLLEASHASIQVLNYSNDQAKISHLHKNVGCWHARFMA